MKNAFARCLSAIVIIALLLVMSSCSSNTEAHQTYTVTMYNGGKAVREWHGVSAYTFGEIGTRLSVDGIYVDVVGDVVIEPE